MNDEPTILPDCLQCSNGARLSPGWVCDLCGRRGRLPSPGETCPPKDTSISHRGEPLPDLHKTVSRNWQLELEHDNAVLRQALGDLLQECVYSIVSGLPFKEKWTQFNRAKVALNETSSVAVVPLADVTPLLEALHMYSADDVVAAFRTKHPKP